MAIGRVLAGVSLVIAASVVLARPVPARADDRVTYEVISGSVNAVTVEYNDQGQSKSDSAAPLPWRTSVTVANPVSTVIDGAALRAIWKPPADGNAWVTARIYMRGSLICETTQTKGQAACYGNKPTLDGGPIVEAVPSTNPDPKMKPIMGPNPVWTPNPGYK